MNRWKYPLKKLAEGLLIIFCIMTLNFFLVRFMPGDVVRHIVGEEEYLNLMSTAPEKIEEIKADYGLDKGLGEQYLTYLRKTVCLDFGNSYRLKMPVLSTILFRCKWTLWLALPTLFLSGLIGGATGLICGWKRGKWFDQLLTHFFLLIQTIPTNCLAILFLIVLAFRAQLFPLGGITSGGLSGIEKILDIWRHMQLPLLVMVLYRTAADHLLMRSTVTLLREEPYVDTAISKGMTDGVLMRRHLLKNALTPYVTSLCMQFGSILSGSMMVEIVFSWKGMGTLIYDSVTGKDYPMLQACFLFIGICVVLANFLGDLLCMAIDPRIREGRKNEA